MTREVGAPKHSTSANSLTCIFENDNQRLHAEDFQPKLGDRAAPDLGGKNAQRGDWSDFPACCFSGGERCVGTGRGVGRASIAQSKPTETESRLGRSIER